MLAILRPIFWLLTLFAVVLAGLSVLGRVLVAVVDDYEDELNSLLGPRDIEIRELSATWHHFDPILRAHSVRFPGGRAQGVVFQLDLLETLWHGAIVAGHLRVDALELLVTRTRDGRWKIGNAAPTGATFDPLPMLLESDELRLDRVELAVATESADTTEPIEIVGSFTASAHVTNAHFRHDGAVVIVAADRAAPIKLDWRLAEGSFGLGLEGAITLVGDGFEVPTALAQVTGGGSIERLHGQWQITEGDGQGVLDVRVHDLLLPRGRLDEVALKLVGRSELWHSNVWARVEHLEARAGQRSSTLDGVGLAYRAGLIDSTLEFAADDISVAPYLPIVRSALGQIPAAREWIDGLAPSGNVRHISGVFRIGERTLSAAANVEDVAFEHFKGVPFIRNGRSDLIATERGFRAHLATDDMTIGLLNVYAAPFELDRIDGNVELWFKDKFVVVKSDDLVGRIGPTEARGAFAVSRPPEREDQRVSLWITADAMDAGMAKQFLPMKLSPELLRWIDESILAGRASDFGIVFHGHFLNVEGLPLRQAEMSFRVDQGRVRFHPDWPIAESLAGHVEIGANGVAGALERGVVQGIDVGVSTIRSPRGGGYVEVDGRGATDATHVRALIDRSPLGEWLGFVTPDWQFSGPLDYRLAMHLPITREAAADDIRVDLAATLQGVDAQLGNIGIALEGLDGPIAYAFPHAVTSAGIDGKLFGSPARFTASYSSDDGKVTLGGTGRADVAPIAAWLGVDVEGMVSGPVDYRGELSLWPGSERDPHLFVTTPLTDVVVDLPAPFGKPATESLATTIDLDLRAKELFIRGVVGDRIAFWVRRPDEGALGAHIGINTPAPPEAEDRAGVVVTGAIEHLVLDPWVERFGRSFGPRLDAVRSGPDPLHLSVDGLAVGELEFRDAIFPDLVANAVVEPGLLELAVDSAAIAGTLVDRQGEPTRIALSRLVLPAGADDDTSDPLADVDPSFIDAIDVVIDDVHVGDADYGSWQFALRGDEQVMRVEDVTGRMRGLTIEGTAPMLWHYIDPPTTRFEGKASGANLAEILPAFSYAASVESKSVAADTVIEWPGSPLAFELATLTGTIGVQVKDGRFVDVDSGGGTMRVFSLLNFTAIAKRMALDFSDVFGKGISFDEVTARVRMDQGRLEFVDPMVIDGTGAYFRVGGRVDFNTGALDNDMVVTLPVSSSLPWYAAYLSFVNPIAAGAVLVGERLFRDQIDQFSSATYKVSGTLTDPKVEFVRVFGRGTDAKPNEAKDDSGPPPDTAKEKEKPS